MEIWALVQKPALEYIDFFSFFFFFTRLKKSFQVILSFATKNCCWYSLQVSFLLANPNSYASVSIPTHPPQVRMIVFSHPIGTINIYLPHSQVLLIA